MSCLLGSWSAAKTRWKAASVSCARRQERKRNTFAISANFTPTPGYCGEIIHMYFASGLTFGEQALDADEFLTVQRIPLAKAVRMVLENEIRDGKTQAAVLKVDALLRAGALEA